MAAGNAVIGALRVVLGADSALLEKGFKSARSSADRFAVGLSSSMKVAVAAMAAAAAGLGLAIKGALNEADELGKMAQKIGIPVEELSALKYAADLSGVSLETLSKGIARLARNMVEGEQGLQTPVRAFEALGLSIRNVDGSIKTVSQALPEIADRFAQMRDGPEKTALAMQLLGRAGTELIPMLNQGSAGIKKMTDEALALGIVIDDKTGKSAEGFNDNLTRLATAMRGGLIQLMSGMAGELEKISERAVDLVKNGDLRSWGIKAGEGFSWILNQAEQLTLGLRRLGVELEAFKKLFTSVPFTEASRKAWADFQAAGEETERQFKALGDRLETLRLIADGAFGTVESGAKGVTAGFRPEIVKATKDALESFIASQYKHIAASDAQASAVGRSAAEQDRMRVVAAALATAEQNNIVVTEAMRQKIVALGDAVYAAQMRLQGAQLTQEVMTPAEQYAQKLEFQTQLFNAGVISAETYARAQQRAAQQAGTSWDIAGASIAGSFQQIAGAFGKQSKTMATIAKAAGIVQATISMFTGAARALELPFPANLAAMAAVLAQGASIVANIKGTQVPNFATGGSFRVGGAGGIDSQRVMMDVSPGEIVDVKKNPYGASSEGDGFRVIEIRDLASRPVWTQEGVRDLIEQMNIAIGNGARLRFQPI